MFKTVSETNNFADRVKFIHLTDFVCNSILNDTSNITGCTNAYSDNKIELKLVPEHKPINPDYQIKEYITNPPKIYGNKE